MCLCHVKFISMYRAMQLIHFCGVLLFRECPGQVRGVGQHAADHLGRPCQLCVPGRQARTLVPPRACCGQECGHPDERPTQRCLNEQGAEAAAAGPRRVVCGASGPVPDSPVRCPHVGGWIVFISARHPVVCQSSRHLHPSHRPVSPSVCSGPEACAPDPGDGEDARVQGPNPQYDWGNLVHRRHEEGMYSIKYL